MKNIENAKVGDYIYDINGKLSVNHIGIGKILEIYGFDSDVTLINDVAYMKVQMRNPVPQLLSYDTIKDFKIINPKDDPEYFI